MQIGGKVVDEPEEVGPDNNVLLCILKVLDFIICTVRSDSHICVSENPAWWIDWI